MSMTIDVRVNGDTISTVGITNTTGHMGADDVNTYEWAYFGDGRRKLADTVEHRFGDGAMVLASKVLAEIALRYEIAAGLAADTPDGPKISPEDAQPQESASGGDA